MKDKNRQKNLSKLNDRQNVIIKYLIDNNESTISELHDEINKSGEVARVTVNRDLEELEKYKFIKQLGQARATKYVLSSYYQFLREIDLNQYFEQLPDQRKINERFNWDIFDYLKEIFYKSELDQLTDLTKEYQDQYKYLSPTILKKEFERLTIELSWKSSRIEGNTYSLIDTEFLLTQGKAAEGKTKEEAIMLLNHKSTLQYIRNNIDTFQKITVNKIIDIHKLLVKDLGVETGIRKSLVGIGGTAFKPLDNAHEIQEALERFCNLINEVENPFAKSLVSLAMISYIQPFADGNKRTSRLIANALLLAFDNCPLSLRSIDEKEYKQAVLVFYEINNISNLKRLFIEQYEFAVKNYFRKSVD